jgi:hypothetical protein
MVFCGQLDHLTALHEEVDDRAAFLFIYVNDAPHEPPHTGPFSKYDLSLPESARRQLIGQIAGEIDLPFHCLFGQDSPAEQAYKAEVQRLVIVDGEGLVAYDAGVGLPYGWDMDEVEKALAEVADCPNLPQ